MIQNLCQGFRLMLCKEKPMMIVKYKLCPQLPSITGINAAFFQTSKPLCSLALAGLPALLLYSTLFYCALTRIFFSLKALVPFQSFAYANPALEVLCWQMFTQLLLLPFTLVCKTGTYMCPVMTQSGPQTDSQNLLAKFIEWAKILLPWRNLCEHLSSRISPSLLLFIVTLFSFCMGITNTGTIYVTFS